MFGARVSTLGGAVVEPEDAESAEEAAGAPCLGVRLESHEVSARTVGTHQRRHDTSRQGGVLKEFGEV